MKNSVLYIVGAIALLGGGAFLFLRNKKLKDTVKLADIKMEKALVVEKEATTQASKELLSANDLLAITKLKDGIIAETKLRNGYKKSSSKANIQVSINQKMAELNKFGFSLDTNNQLIKIR